MTDVRHIITGLQMGGAEHALLKLLSGEAALREGARVLSLRDLGVLGPQIQRLGVPVEAVGIHGSLPSPAAMRRLRTMVARHPAPVLHGWMYHGNLAALFAAGAVHPRPRVIWNVQHSVYSLGSEKPMTAMVIRLGALWSERASVILYNSRVAAAQHERLGYDARRTRIIPNGFDTTRFRPSPELRDSVRQELAIPAGVPVIGLIGRYHPMKDHANFLDAAARVLAASPTVRLLLAGPDVDAGNGELTARIHRLGLGGAVLLLGARPDPERLFAAMDILCLSSSSEGSPNVVGEGMAAGLPCVVTDVGDAGWLVAETGTVVPPRDSEALAAGLLAMLALPHERRAALGAAARERIQREFGLPAIAGLYAQLHDEMAHSA